MAPKKGAPAAAAAAKKAAEPPPPAKEKDRGGRRTAHFAALEVVGESPSDPAKRNARGTFDVFGVDLCIVNALRRAIMADVRTVAIAFDPTGTLKERSAGVLFKKNTGVLHNEFLGHRLSMVPLGFAENQLQGYDPAAYRFVLRVKNAGDAVIDVTTADFEVHDVTGAAVKGLRDEVFPPSPISGDHVLLARLKPSATGDANGEEIELECRARLGSGREHARWSPVSACFFRNKVDPAAFETSLAAKVAKAEADAGNNGVDVDNLRRQHAALDGLRDFYRNEQGEPSAFEFVLKSESRLGPAYLVFQGMCVLADKVRRMVRGLGVESAATAAAGATSDEDAVVGGGGGGGDDGIGHDASRGWGSSGAVLGGKDKARVAGSRDAEANDPLDAAEVRVRALANMDDFYEVAVRDEDHTLGNLVQGLLYRHWVRDGGAVAVSFIGYHQPHPLEPEIVFKIKCARAADDVRALFLEGLAWCLAQIDALAEEWVRFSELPRTLGVVDALLRRRETLARVTGGRGPDPAQPSTSSRSAW